MFHQTANAIGRYFFRRALRFCLFLLLHPYLAASQTLTCSVEWNPAIQVSFDSVLSNGPQVAVSGDTVHLVWYGFDTLGTAGRDGIQYARSADGGVSFSEQETLLPLESALSPAVVASAGNFVYVAALAFVDTFLGTIVLRSSDGGITWQPPRTLLRGTRPEVIVAGDSSVYIHFRTLIGRRAGLFASTNTGLSWDTIASTIPHLSSLVLRGNQFHGVGIVATDFGTEVGYFSSTTPGRSWFGPEILSKEDTIPSLRPRIAANERGKLFVVWGEGGRLFIRRSINNGYSWRPEQLLSADTSAVFSEIAAGDDFVSVIWDNDFGGSGGISFRSSNDVGTSFCPLASPTAGTNVGEPAVAILGDRVHVTWTESIAGNVEILYRRGLLTENPNSLEKPPTSFALHQNYPNPFNGATHIRYDIPEPMAVELVVYNLLGEIIATLVNEVQSPDRYDFVFDSGNYPSGVYFFRLRTRSFTEVRKLLIVR